MDAIRQMSHGRHSLSVATGRSSPMRLPGRRGIAALAFTALVLAGCGSRSAPLSQPLDAGQQAQAGTDRHLAENGDHERVLPNGGPAAQGGGDLLTNGAHPPVAGPAMPIPQQIAPPPQAADDPTQPTGAEPLLDAGGFEPTPQSGGELDHNSGNNSGNNSGSSDSTTAGALHN